MTYYIIAQRDDATSPFCIEWGSYDKHEAIGERDTMLESPCNKARNIKVIKCASDMTVDCNAAIDALNGKEAIAIGDYVTTPAFDVEVEVTGRDTGMGDLIVRYVRDNGSDAFKTIPAFSARRYVESAA